MKVTLPDGTEAEIPNEFVYLENRKNPGFAIIAGSIYRLEMVLEKFLKQRIEANKMLEGLLKDISRSIEAKGQ
ncbi:MAG: hypothetical protein FVQ80_15230 [Planctomycetes bacterium]|nr:hypothetical protein [Planctomycetota bacterium]